MKHSESSDRSSEREAGCQNGPCKPYGCYGSVKIHFLHMNSTKNCLTWALTCPNPEMKFTTCKSVQTFTVMPLHNKCLSTHEYMYNCIWARIGTCMTVHEFMLGWTTWDGWIVFLHVSVRMPLSLSLNECFLLATKWRRDQCWLVYF
jgi:hypothetical protein